MVKELDKLKKDMIKYFFILIIVIVILFLYQFVAGYFIRNRCLMNAYKDSEQYVPTLKEFSDGRKRGSIFEYLYKDCLKEYWLLDL